MPADVTFNLRNHVDYIRSFAALRDKLGSRAVGAVLEVEVLMPGDVSVTLFLECRSLYFIGFRGAAGKVIALHGDHQDFAAFLKATID